jgi:hypothetical protein
MRRVWYRLYAVKMVVQTQEIVSRNCPVWDAILLWPEQHSLPPSVWITGLPKTRLNNPINFGPGEADSMFLQNAEVRLQAYKALQNRKFQFWNITTLKPDTYIGSFKMSFTTFKTYINLFRGYLQCFELS